MKVHIYIKKINNTPSYDCWTKILRTSIFRIDTATEKRLWYSNFYQKTPPKQFLKQQQIIWKDPVLFNDFRVGPLFRAPNKSFIRHTMFRNKRSAWLWHGKSHYTLHPAGMCKVGKIALITSTNDRKGKCFTINPTMHCPTKTQRMLSNKKAVIFQRTSPAGLLSTTIFYYYTMTREAWSWAFQSIFLRHLAHVSSQFYKISFMGEVQRMSSYRAAQKKCSVQDCAHRALNWHRAPNNANWKTTNTVKRTGKSGQNATFFRLRCGKISRNLSVCWLHVTFSQFVRAKEWGNVCEG